MHNVFTGTLKVTGKRGDVERFLRDRIKIILSTEKSSEKEEERIVDAAMGEPWDSWILAQDDRTRIVDPEIIEPDSHEMIFRSPQGLRAHRFYIEDANSFMARKGGLRIVFEPESDGRTSVYLPEFVTPDEMPAERYRQLSAEYKVDFSMSACNENTGWSLEADVLQGKIIREEKVRSDDREPAVRR